MRAISKIGNMFIATAAALLFSVSCVRDTEGVDCARMQDVTLTLSTVSSSTRADGHDDVEDDNYAQNPEERISRVDLFFFADSESEGEPLYVHEVSVNATTKIDLAIKIPIEIKNSFTAGKGYVYALVNLPGSVKVDASAKSIAGKPATLENLQKVWVGEQGFVSATAPGSFVMRGDGDIELQQGAGGVTSASGVVKLERLASKIRLWASLAGEIYLDKSGRTIERGEDESEESWKARCAETWRPIPAGEGEYEKMKLYIYNVATKGRIDADVTDKSLLGYASVERGGVNDAVNKAARTLETGADLPAADRFEPYPYSHTTAYYSYPNEWDSASTEDKNQTYVVVSLLWGRVNPDSDSGEMFDLYRPCYYEVPVNALKQSDTDAAADCLEPNKYYRIKINIGMLGSKDLGEPLPVDATWEVVDWVSADVDVNIKDRRYLVVNQKEWVMNNVSNIEIPFSSSHKVKKVYCYVNYFRYNDVWGTAPNTNNVHNVDEFDEWVKSATGNLTNKGLTEGLISASFESEDQTQNPVVSTSRGIVWKVNRWFPDFWWIGRWVMQTTTNITNYVNHTSLSEDLYYKDEYFYDKIKDQYLYYLGHEHPITFQPDFVEYTDEQLGNNTLGMTGEDRNAWDQYRAKYGMNAVYTCTIDEEKGVINFSHPLIQWRAVRTLVDKGIENENPSFVETDSSEDIWGNIIKTNTRTIVHNYEGALKYYVPELNPRTSALWDEFSRCEIIIKIKHEDYEADDGLFEETIHITQYPAMYVEVSHDYGDIYQASNRGNQYVKVNGLGTENPNEDNYGTATEWWETTSWVRYFGEINNNPNMYVIHTSQLSEENEVLYDLGDPRTLHYNNDLSDESFTGNKNVGNSNIDNSNNQWPSIRLKTQRSGFVREEVVYDEYTINIANTTSRLYTDSDKLKYYYPTDETDATDAGTKANFIAPSFRIASSFGKVSLMYNASEFDERGNSSEGQWTRLNGVSRAEARRRCASYQEAGRPAGRWRVPTIAEIRYLVQLSTDGKIPHLFGHQSLPDMYVPYWSSTGLIGVRFSDSDISTTIQEKDLETSPAVRCIYDEWYWTQIDGGDLPTPDGVLEMKFYWGDKEKDNTQTQAIMQRAINKKPIQAIERN